MICPKCKVRNEFIINGQSVAIALHQCVYCGYILTSTDEERFLRYCAENIQREITEFKRTNDVECISKASAYMDVMKLHIEGDLPARPEVSV